MNEVLDTTTELTFADWDDPREQLHQYIIGPEPYPAADALTYSTERGPVFETDPDLLLPNERGLEQLLARGALRKASLEDLNVWTIGYVNAHNRAPNLRHVPPHDGYVVLRETELPAGLAGAHAVFFIVSPGVPPPEKAPGHSVVLITDGYRCLGVLCDE